MTIESATTRSSYDGNGVTTAFSVGFTYFDDAHVTVIHVDSNGTETTWVKGTQYTLSGDGSAGTGQVDVDTSPTDYTPASGEKLVVLLAPPNKQEVALPSGDYLDDIERMGDIIVQQILNLLDGNNRALLAPLSESSIGNLPTAAARMGKLLQFNVSTGDPEAVAAADVDLATVTAFIGTLLDDADAATARATLGAAGTGAANIFTKTQTWAKGADVASAGELTLGDGNYFDVTGTTAITSIATKEEGTVVKLHFDDALTLTHHATDLILPGAANITTAAGDEAEFVEYAAGDWRCTNYQKANGAALAGGTNVQSFTSSGTWNKPSSGTYALVECWGGGGSGGKNTDASEAGGGGGGGAYTYGRFLLSDLGSTETVTIGAGGAARSTRSAGAVGGNTTFGSHLTAYGGGAGGLNSGGGGASPLAVGSVGNDGLTVAGGAAGSLGGAGGSSNSAGEDNWAGGGGGGSDTNGTGGFGGIGGAGGGGGGVNGDGAAGGNSYYGGGGGGGGWGGSGGGSTGGAGGTSQVGGNGGAGNTTGTDGTQPAGGGGGSNSGNSGAGGDGLVRVTVF